MKPQEGTLGTHLVRLKKSIISTKKKKKRILTILVDFFETQSQFGNYEDEIDEEYEKLLEAFLSKDAGPQRTLADIIIQKIKENDGNVASETRPLPK
ncbi:hypothetical protein PVK06_031251 [Gossypium arboreum]|uniref:Uncharacterized protein n=1 Tax=Gossypium arboreum TaxID=29729 RepID=A0ABR0NTQ1_GOSAR|nr:hypothetical protein PVK06_031251 [Gossypium arboreum]